MVEWLCAHSAITLSVRVVYERLLKACTFTLKTQTWNVIECSKFYVFIILTKSARPPKEKKNLFTQQATAKLLQTLTRHAITILVLFTSRVKHKILFFVVVPNMMETCQNHLKNWFTFWITGKWVTFCFSRNCIPICLFIWVSNYCIRSISHQLESQEKMHSTNRRIYYVKHFKMLHQFFPIWKTLHFMQERRRRVCVFHQTSINI